MKSQLFLDLGTFVIALATVLLCTPLVRRLASHGGMLDALGERRMHEVPKPRIGGIAVYLGFVFALFSAAGVALSSHRFGASETHSLLGLLFGSTLILCVGVWDDIMTMRPRPKFLAQIVVALISMLYGFRIDGVANPFVRHHPWIGFPLWFQIALTLVWYLGMMNAINFIDGLDGLLPGVTAICGAFIMAIALMKGHAVVAIVLVALVGATLGFLPYNFNPAKIILGDSGALFIGFVFATTSVIGEAKGAVTISLLVPVIVLALPIIDTAATIVRRTAAGRRITDADRGHFHHQLIFRFGLNVKQAVLVIYAVCFALGAIALLLAGGVGGLRLAFAQ